MSYFKCTQSPNTDTQLIENVKINDCLQLLLLQRAWQTEIKRHYRTNHRTNRQHRTNQQTKKSLL